jgi:hypothetical protein
LIITPLLIVTSLAMASLLDTASHPILTSLAAHFLKNGYFIFPPLQALIIQLLGQAMAQFKVYKCLRFRKKLAVDMAEEYLKCGDHSRALT